MKAIKTPTIALCLLISQSQKRELNIYVDTKKKKNWLLTQRNLNINLEVFNPPQKIRAAAATFPNGAYHSF